MDERTSIEEKLAWMEHYVLELDGVVRGLAGQVEELRAEVLRLRASRAEGGGEEEQPEPGALLVHERPPHY